MTLDRATMNIIQMGIGFFLNFVAFNAADFIQESVINSASKSGKIDEYAGYYSLAIVYATFALGNLISAPIINALSPKYAMSLSVLTYAAFQGGFLYLNVYYLYFSSAFVGFGASILWAGQGAYLSQNCTETTTSRNSAITWALTEGSLLGGGLLLYVIFSQSTSSDSISPVTADVLYSVFTGLSLVSAAVLFLLQAPAYQEKVEKIQAVSFFQRVYAPFELLRSRKMQLLTLVFAYTGVEQAFWTGVYPTCISFTKKLGNDTNVLLALNSIYSGAAQILAGLIFGLLGDKTRRIGRDAVVLFGAFVHLIVFVMIYLNFPADASLNDTISDGAILKPNVIIAMVSGGLLAFGDACWNTQIYSLLCESYPTQSSEAFAMFRFFQAGMECFAFVYSSVLQLQYILVIMAGLSVFAAASFFLVEQLESTEISGLSLNDLKFEPKTNDSVYK
ncbi:unnamed protein product [Caenorhabditis auriculariae]|uniref:UNC93-like protein MFSD11 n=1 Tax=Caenorhabditis auriculariae TaxID=2777116 RepID=A0A8S1H2Z7_9PELO|nr:unnamed protein product [Caenorhabditis auriculariae]